MLHADDRCFRHLGVTDRQVFEIDRRYPFAAGLDHVLGAVGDLHVAVAVDGRDVAGVEQAILVEDRIALDLVIALATAGPRTLRRPNVLPSQGSGLPLSSVIFISTPNGG